MRNELKPCPFCGGEAIIHKRAYDNRGGLPHDFTVYCDKCHASVRHYYPTEKEAIEAWNRRADNDR